MFISNSSQSRQYLYQIFSKKVLNVYSKYFSKNVLIVYITVLIESTQCLHQIVPNRK